MTTINQPRTAAHTLTPTREAVRDLFTKGNLVPVYATMLADLETPVSVYLKLSQLGVASFLLESVEGGERVARYSFLGVNPRGLLRFEGRDVHASRGGGPTETFTLEADRDPLDVIREEMVQSTPVPLDGLPRFVGGAVGYFSYDVVHFFERLPATAEDELGVPEGWFMLPDTLIVFDHAMHRLIVLANARYEGDADAAYDDAARRIEELIEVIRAPLPVAPSEPVTTGGDLQSNMPRERYEAIVREAKEYIAAGDAFQIVLSQRFTRETDAHPLTIYRALRALNPSPYMFMLRFDEETCLIGASPETLVSLEDGKATVRPIAGTRPRGKTEREDDALAEELLADPKERAEHVMLVDLGRNDLGRVSEYGTVSVERMMVIERYSHVMHIVSEVTGTVKPGMDGFDLFRATFPAGTLSGAPKIRAMEIIEELEDTQRGPYGGAVGYFSYDGSMDMCITIRSMLMKGKRVYIQAGAGIVADSDPATEYEETVNKAKALDVALQRAEEGL